MKKIVVIGAGGFAREVKFLIEEINRKEKEYEFLGYLVSDLSQLSELDSKDEVLGDLSWLEDQKGRVNVAIGIGTPNHRLRIGEEISKNYLNVMFPPLIHPNAIYDRNSCWFERGVIICSSNVLTVNVRIEEFAMLNLCCRVGHEAIIGAGSVLNPSVNISGGVIIGEKVLVGTGVQILQYLNICSNTIIAASSLVTKNIFKKGTYWGIPAKLLR